MALSSSLNFSFLYSIVFRFLFDGAFSSFMDTKFISRTIAGGLLVIILCLFYFQIIKGEGYLSKAKNNYIKAVNYPSIRGSVFDRNKTLLAVDKPNFNLAVIPYQIKGQKDSLFKELSYCSGMSEKRISVYYRRNFKNIFSPVDILINIDKEKALEIKDKFKEKVVLRVIPKRFYTFDYEFSHLLGYVKEDKVVHKDIKKYGYSPYQIAGVNGIERTYNDFLKGEGGAELIEVNSRGRIVGFLGKRERVKGKDVFLSVDSRIQKIAYESLGEFTGTIIIMNPHTGEIISLVSKPSFNLNDFIEAKNIEKIFDDRKKPLINRAVQARYPLGSVFKVIVAIAALEERIITPFTTFTCEGKLAFGDTVFKCWSIHGQQDLYNALAHSCNVYFYQLGLRLKVEKIAKWAKIFSLDKLSGIDLPYEKKGLVPERKWKKKHREMNWFGGDTLNFSIGQGYLTVTPIRSALFMSAFVNGGYLVSPYVVKTVEGQDISYPKKVKIPVSSNNLKIVNQGLRGVISKKDGTAHLLESLNLKIAGKTGTAQTAGKSHGWFVGFFPYNNPKYTMCVFLENGGSGSKAVEVTYEMLKRLKEDNLL